MMFLETPGLVIDRGILLDNLARMAALAKKNGVALRPHTKTHKCVEIARMQVDAGAEGITVAKVSEAEVMAAAGFRDIFIAYPLIGADKIKRLLALGQDSRIIAGVDSLAGAGALAAAAAGIGRQQEVRLEIDIGFRRSGVLYDEAADLAAAISRLKGLRLTGVYCFKALTLAGKPTVDRQEAGYEEGRLAVAIAERIRRRGIAIREVSVGSTPTSEFAAAIPGVTEIRPGTYALNDIATVRSGACTMADCAAWIVATIVSKPCAERMVIDGGCKTFATDVALGSAPWFLDRHGRIVEDDCLILERFSEEHGMIRIAEGAKDFQIGDRLSVIPNHICPTVNLHDTFTWMQGGGIIGKGRVDARGRVT